MSKLLTTLIAAVFAVTTTSAFAQAPAKGDTPKGAPPKEVTKEPKAAKTADTPKAEKKPAKVKKSKKSKGKAKSDTMADTPKAEKKAGEKK